MNFYVYSRDDDRQYEEKLLAEQDNKCIICEDAIGDKFHVDRDLDTGIIQAIFCLGCYAQLQFYYDDGPRLLHNWLEYLASHKQAPGWCPILTGPRGEGYEGLQEMRQREA